MSEIEMLMQFGLKRQEAIVYLKLLSEGVMNGYEAAKLTGLSRSNAYTALASLVEKGCAYVIEGATVRYTPVPTAEFCGNIIQKLKETMRDLSRQIPDVKPAVDEYVTIKGREHILNKIRNMVNGAEERLYLSASGQVLEAIMPELKNKAKKGIKVVLITDVQSVVYATVMYTQKNAPHQIRLIVDSAYVLTGDVDNEYSTCLYSAKKNLVDLIKDSIKNEIRIIEMTKGKDT